MRLNGWLYGLVMFAMTVIVLIVIIGIVVLYDAGKNVMTPTAEVEFKANVPERFRTVVEHSSAKRFTVYNIDGSRFCAWTLQRVSADTSTVLVGDTLTTWFDLGVIKFNHREHPLTYDRVTKFTRRDHAVVITGIIDFRMVSIYGRENMLVLAIANQRDTSYTSLSLQDRADVAIGDTLRMMPDGWHARLANGRVSEIFYPPIELSRQPLFYPLRRF